MTRQFLASINSVCCALVLLSLGDGPIEVINPFDMWMYVSCSTGMWGTIVSRMSHLMMRFL